MEPLVSILITTYNRPIDLVRAIKSAINQTYENIEIVITDNSANNDSKRLIEDLFSINSKVKYFSNEKNIGAVANWRKALEWANGIYCVILPDDDYFINCFYIEDAIKIIARDNTDLLITACCYGHSESKISCSSIQQKLLVNGVEFYQNFWEKYRVSTIANVFSKELALKMKAFSNIRILYSDIELWLKMASVTNVSYYNIPSVYYKFHNKNIVTNMSVVSLIESAKE